MNHNIFKKSIFIVSSLFLFTIVAFIATNFEKSDNIAFAVTQPEHSTTVWNFEGQKDINGSAVQQNRRYKYFKHKFDVKDSLVSVLAVIGHNALIAETDATYSTTEAEVYSININGKFSAGVETCVGGVEVASIFNVSNSVTLSGTYSAGQTLTAANQSGIYELRLYVQIFYYEIEEWLPNIKYRSEPYTEGSGKDAVEKTRQVAYQDGWIFGSNHEQWFVNTISPLQTISFASNRVGDLPVSTNIL